MDLINDDCLKVLQEMPSGSIDLVVTDPPYLVETDGAGMFGTKNYNGVRYVMEHIDFTRFQDAGDLKKITQKPFMQTAYIRPSLAQQRAYTAFVSQVDKSKVVVQKALDEAQLLFDSLMQQYFG